VNDALSSELQNGVHALSIVVSEEWICKEIRNSWAQKKKPWHAAAHKSPGQACGDACIPGFLSVRRISLEC
jgi:hypothetical protein